MITNATSSTSSYELADTGARFIAYFIDGIIVSVINFIVGFVLGLVIAPMLVGGARTGSALNGAQATLQLIGFVAGLLVQFAYYAYFWTSTGQTPGKQVMKIRVVKEDGTPITTGTALARYLGMILGGAVFLLGFIWALFDSKHQAWHDKIAGTLVVKA